MKVIIAGSRDNTTLQDVYKACDNSQFEIEEVVSGGARGVDAFGEEWAYDSHIPKTLFLPDWNLFGKRAGFLRNEDMAQYADALIAVWDGKSRGTKHMIDTMKKLNKPVEVMMV